MIVIATENRDKTIVTLCDDDWDLPTQLDELYNWLKGNISQVQNGRYIADIAFGIRSEASGGGAVLSKEMIDLLASIHLEIYFSEYNFIDEDD